MVWEEGMNGANGARKRNFLSDGSMNYQDLKESAVIGAPINQCECWQQNYESGFYKIHWLPKNGSSTQRHRAEPVDHHMHVGGQVKELFHRTGTHLATTWLKWWTPGLSRSGRPRRLENSRQMRSVWRMVVVEKEPLWLGGGNARSHQKKSASEQEMTACQSLNIVLTC